MHCDLVESWLDDEMRRVPSLVAVVVNVDMKPVGGGESMRVRCMGQRKSGSNKPPAHSTGV
jgi:hypothetical protein